MAYVKIEAPDDLMPQVVDAFCRTYNYQSTVPVPDKQPPETQPNPESREQFAGRMIVKYMRSVVEADANNQAQISIKDDLKAVSDLLDAAAPNVFVTVDGPGGSSTSSQGTGTTTTPPPAAPMKKKGKKR